MDVGGSWVVVWMNAAVPSGDGVSSVGLAGDVCEWVRAAVLCQTQVPPREVIDEMVLAQV